MSEPQEDSLPEQNASRAAGPVARLYYVSDPMCSWCWGFAQTLQRSASRWNADIALQLVLGGLAPDSSEPMDPETRAYVRRAWAAVEERSGAPFNHEFWERCTPARSTWPACRAVLAAGARSWEMFSAIQHAYYREARDPSQPAVLVELAVELGFDGPSFAQAIDAPATHARLQRDFDLRDRLGLSGFPSVALERDGQVRILTRGWCGATQFEETLRAAGIELRSESAP